MTDERGMRYAVFSNGWMLDQYVPPCVNPDVTLAGVRAYVLVHENFMKRHFSYTLRTVQTIDEQTFALRSSLPRVALESYSHATYNLRHVARYLISGPNGRWGTA